MSGTSSGGVWPGLAAIARPPMETAWHALDEGVWVAGVDIRKPWLAGHDPDGIHYRFGVVEDGFVVQSRFAARCIAISRGTAPDILNSRPGSGRRGYSKLNSASCFALSGFFMPCSKCSSQAFAHGRP